MALFPPVAEMGKEEGKENIPIDDDNDFVPLKKKPKFNPEDVKAMFPQSTLIAHSTSLLVQSDLFNKYCFAITAYSTFNIQHSL